MYPAFSFKHGALTVTSPTLVSNPPSADHAHANGVLSTTKSSDFVVITATGMRFLITLSTAMTSEGTCDSDKGTLMGLIVPS